MKYKRQKGAVLLIAIILLLVMTIIGISAVRSSASKTQIAGNSISRMLVYQGAESALAQIVSANSMMNIKILDDTGQDTKDFALPDETIQGSATLNVSARLTRRGESDCMRRSSTANSTTMKCVVYRIDGFSQIQSTNARGHHIKGVEMDAPISN